MQWPQTTDSRFTTPFTSLLWTKILELSLTPHLFSHLISSSSANLGGLPRIYNPNPIPFPNTSASTIISATISTAGLLQYLLFGFPALIFATLQSILYPHEWAFKNLNQIMSLLVQYSQWLLILLKVKCKFFIKLYKTQQNLA